LSIETIVYKYISDLEWHHDRKWQTTTVFTMCTGQNNKSLQLSFLLMLQYQLKQEGSDSG